MLTVGVHCDDNIRVQLFSSPKASHRGCTYSKIREMAEHQCALLASDLSGVVDRTIINHDRANPHTIDFTGNVCQDGTDDTGFVVGRHHHCNRLGGMHGGADFNMRKDIMARLHVKNIPGQTNAGMRPDVVCLSTQDWNGLWTRKQRFMQMFARQGRRVLYVETPVHLLGFDVLPQDPGRFFRFVKGPRPIEANLCVATLPILLPFFQMSHWINAANAVMVGATLRQWIHRLGFDKPLLWIYTPSSAPLLEKVPHSGVIYECVDEFRAAKGFIRSSVIGEMEEALLRKADLCIVTQETLFPRRSALCPNTFVVPNGADTDLFTRAAQDSSPSQIIDRIAHPRLGFVGHIQYWVDLKLIRYLADRRPSWNFVLIGPVHPMADASHIRGVPNIHLLGLQPQSEVPRILRGVDVCLNVYKADDVASHASPLKLYEYLAAGKPIVSTDMPEARKFREFVSIANSYEEFLAKCDETLVDLPETESAIQKRIQIAAQHSWVRRFAEVNALVDQTFSAMPSPR
jgi:glycosyltransferase involved in cell wall biosynthesis